MLIEQCDCQAGDIDPGAVVEIEIAGRSQRDFTARSQNRGGVGDGVAGKIDFCAQAIGHRGCRQGACWGRQGQRSAGRIAQDRAWSAGEQRRP